MRVLLLGFGKIAYMPYMNFYLDELKKKKDIEVELVFWDRDGKLDAEVPDCISKAYKFEAHLEEQLPFKKKLKYFAQYRSFALKVLRKNKYDRIIVLHTTPGLTLIDQLRRHYKGQYILDFRDVSYEYMPAYRKLVGRLASGSAITFISSNAFRKFLPKLENIYTIHNYLEDSLAHRCLQAGEPRKRNTLRISYWGLVRQVGVNKKVIDAFGNDSRFELHYYGRMQQDGRDMEEYARENQYSNVFFHGQYMPEDRYNFAANTELIHNLYDCGNTTGNAMGNKYYDGIIFEIPQLCTDGSYMGKEVVDHRVGIVVDLDDKKMGDQVFNYYQSLDWPQFEKDCASALSEVLEEQNRAKEQLRSFIR